MKIMYRCDICKRELDYRRHRLQHQTFTKAPYSHKVIQESLDLCTPCYKKIAKHIKELQKIFENC